MNPGHRVVPGLPPQLPGSVRTRITAAIDGAAGDLAQLAAAIHAAAEPAFAERESAALTRAALARAGFTVSGVPGGPATSFAAQAGRRGPVIALCAEYDALPGLGHACGHNLIAAAAVGAGAALAQVAGEIGLRVRVIGCPAEESGGGKALLLGAGAFDGAAAVLMAHPGTAEQSWFSSFALASLRARFTGAGGHPARDSAQPDAREARQLAEIALGLLRSRLPAGACVLWACLDQPGAPAIRPAVSDLAVEVRARTPGELRDAGQRARDCLRGAALAAGAQAEITSPEPDYLPMRTDPLLAALWEEELARTGRACGPDPGPYAITDLGNVSQHLPALHAILALGDGTAGPHEAQFARLAADLEEGTGAGGQARRWILDAAATLALTGARAASGLA